MTNPLFIREAALDDRDIIRNIGRETYAEHFAHIWSPQGMERYMEQEFSLDALSLSLSNSNAHQWLLASDANEDVVGFAKVNWSRPDPIDGETGAELQKIYFRAADAGKGYGGRLLAYAIEAAARRGASTMWLDVLASNTAAQRFYTRHDFVEIGEVTFDTDTGTIEMRVMKRTVAL